MSASAELVVLGAGSILPRAGYGCAGYALRPTPDGALTLFDCGPGSLRALGVGSSSSIKRRPESKGCGRWAWDRSSAAYFGAPSMR